MKIGLPRALMYHYYYPFWRSLLENLNFEIVVSDETSKSLVQPGINVTVAEICLPIKIFNAHVIDLKNKNVDYIFLPRFVSIEKHMWFCPKYIGLPELVKNTIPGVKLLVPEIDVKKEDTCALKAYLPVCKELGIPLGLMQKALKKASADWARFRQLCIDGLSIDEAHLVFYENYPIEKFKEIRHNVTIGLLGYVYNIYDPFISMNIISKLRAMGVNVVTFEMLSDAQLHKYRKKGEKLIYWTFTDKLYQAAHVMLDDLASDGLVHVTAFGCGPDSIVGKKIEYDFEGYKKPFMTLRVDEHTGESHLQTRIEAFVDMIKRKKAQVNEALV